MHNLPVADGRSISHGPLHSGKATKPDTTRSYHGPAHTIQIARATSSIPPYSERHFPYSEFPISSLPAGLSRRATIPLPEPQQLHSPLVPVPSSGCVSQAACGGSSPIHIQIHIHIRRLLSFRFCSCNRDIHHDHICRLSMSPVRHVLPPFNVPQPYHTALGLREPEPMLRRGKPSVIIYHFAGNWILTMTCLTAARGNFLACREPPGARRPPPPPNNGAIVARCAHNNCIDLPYSTRHSRCRAGIAPFSAAVRRAPPTILCSPESRIPGFGVPARSPLTSVPNSNRFLPANCRSLRTATVRSSAGSATSRTRTVACLEPP
ncbi:hypothetical protein OH76DRAFT_1099375 [Lentinus brumalis]|uniref:Uncharacterized protein n=1 Tax=Lentinus brumalis TaxID=2498619 RepID=A0A371CVW9_9APHY|nr:hypothetical protein OH76DRAFT_1099375 [Polyporus brumalis]